MVIGGDSYMIIILDKNLNRQMILKKTISAERYEQLNGENTLSFKTILGKKEATYITEDSILELNGDYFDIVYLEKSKTDDDASVVVVDAEHVSYRLNDEKYDVEEFVETGNPSTILTKILSGTEFSIGDIDITDNVTYAAQEKKSRRQLLMEFAKVCKGDLIFNKFSISLVKKRGSRDPKLFATGKNISVVSKIVDKTERDEDGNPKVSYTCTSVVLDSNYAGVGDDILLVQRELGIQETLRVLSHRYDPYRTYSTEYEIGNFISDMEDKVYEIETGTVAKEKLYNGVKIGPNEGFVAEAKNKNDPTGKVFARTIMNATEGISIYSSTGDGDSLQRNFFVDMDGRIKANELDIAGDATFQGTVHASTIETSEFIGGRIEAAEIVGGSINIGETSSGYYDYNFSVDSAGNLFARNGYFEGDINASFITGSTITSSNIDVDTSVTIGNFLYIGSNTGSSGYKGIDISHGGNSTWLEVNSSGNFEIYSWGRMTLDAFDDILIRPTTVEFDVYGFLVDSAEIILDGDSYLWNNATEDNRIATWGDLDDLRNDILDYIEYRIQNIE